MTAIHTLPIYQWLGQRPFPFDLTPDDTAHAIYLTLIKEGTLALLPIGQEQNMPKTPNTSPQTFQADALTRDLFRYHLNTLIADGWQQNGRIHITFHGHATDPLFDHTTQTYLWQTPSSKADKA